MSETKFTPGPWRHNEDEGSMWFEGGIGMSANLIQAERDYHVEFLSIERFDGAEIARVSGPTDDSVIDPDEEDYLKWPCTDEEAYANAYLIAAAPELYAALKGVIQLYVRTVGENFDPHKVSEIIVACSAISKAQGENA